MSLNKPAFGQFFLAIAPFVLLFGPATSSGGTQSASIAIWGLIFAVLGVQWGAQSTKLEVDGSPSKPRYGRAILVLICWSIAALLAFAMFRSGRGLRWEVEAGIAGGLGTIALFLLFLRRRKGDQDRSRMIPAILAIAAIAFAAFTGFTGWSHERRDAAAAADFLSFMAQVNEGGELPTVGPAAENFTDSETAMHILKNCTLARAKNSRDFDQISVQDSIDEVVVGNSGSANGESLESLVSKQRLAVQEWGTADQDIIRNCRRQLDDARLDPEILAMVNTPLMRGIRTTQAWVAEQVALLDEISAPENTNTPTRQ